MTESDVIRALWHINPVREEPPPPRLAPLLERLEQGPRPRAGVRRPWRLAGAGGALAAAAAVSVALLAGGEVTPNVAAEMFRATTPGEGVLHMQTVTEQTVGGRTRTTQEQFWSEQRPRRVHLRIANSEATLESALTTSPPKLLQWEAANPGVIRQSVPQGVADVEQTPVAVLRELYAKGELTLAGKTTYQGQPAWQLEAHPEQGRPSLEGRALPNPTVLVSASTFVPLEFTEWSVTTEDGSPQALVTTTRYVAYEELPRDPGDEALLELAGHPGASVEVEG